MAIEAHKCNVTGCSGFVVFENADFDFHNPETIKGIYAFDNPNCNVCGKEFLVVPSYSVIDFDENKREFEEIKSASITDWQKQKI